MAIFLRIQITNTMSDNRVPELQEQDGFDNSRVKQLFQDKRFVTFLTGAGVCLVMILYYFMHHTNPKEEQTKITSVKLNPNLPNAGDTLGLPAKSKLELATDVHSLAMPDQGQERGLNATVPSMVQPEVANRSNRDEVKSYIYGDATPDEVYEQPASDRGPQNRSHRRASAPSYRTARAEPDFDEEDDELPKSKSREELEKDKKMLALLQEYKADKMKRQQEAQGRALKPETVSATTVSSLNGATGKNSFYGLQSDMRRQQMDAREDSLSVTVKAVVFSDQTIISGGRVTLRLLETITLRGRTIPEGTRLYGVASFGGQRVNITINQVQHEGRILPMKLTVFDMDGLSGIYVPNVSGLKQGRQAVAQAGQGFNVSAPIMGSNVPGLAAASALQAGLQGGRSFLSRKVTTPKATLKNNYYVLLK